jgi:hypothetical protein
MENCSKCGCATYSITEKLYDIVTKEWVNSYKCVNCGHEW